MVCKRFVDKEPHAWKTILSHYLEPVGGKIIFCCNFDVKKLSISIPTFYRECLECFTLCSAAANKCELELSHEEICNTVIWNNEYICIDGKSVFNPRLAGKGILRVGDLITESNQLITKCNLVRQWEFSPKDVFDLISLIDAIPAPWRRSLKSYGYPNKQMFILDDQIHLVLNNHKISIDKVISKGVYEELISQFVTPPTAQLRYNENFNTVCLDWKEIYSLPFKVSLDTKSREFQYKILNRYLTTNTYLKRIGKIDSSACSFCGTTDESLEHPLVTCQFTEIMWEDLISWCNNQNIKLKRSPM